MTVRAARSLTVVAATAIVGLAVGSTAAGSATTEPPAGSAAGRSGLRRDRRAARHVDVAIGLALVNGRRRRPLAASARRVGATSPRRPRRQRPTEIAAEVETLVADRRGDRRAALDGRRSRATSKRSSRPSEATEAEATAAACHGRSGSGRSRTADTPLRARRAVRRRSPSRPTASRSTPPPRRRRPASMSTSPTSTAAPTSACPGSGRSRARTATGR